MNLQLWLVFLSATLMLAPTTAIAEDGSEKSKEKFVELLQGEWQMTSRMEDGVASDADLIKSRRAIFVDNTYTVRDGERIFAQITSYTIDLSKKPAWLDITFKNGGTDQAIITVDGDTLTMCFAEGGDRPNAFETKEGDGRILATYTRVKK